MKRNWKAWLYILQYPVYCCFGVLLGALLIGRKIELFDLFPWVLGILLVNIAMPRTTWQQALKRLREEDERYRQRRNKFLFILFQLAAAIAIIGLVYLNHQGIKVIPISWIAGFLLGLVCLLTVSEFLARRTFF